MRASPAHAQRCAREKLDAILLFAQESLYYLTGFDTSGFVFFQCAVLTAGSDEIVLLTRRPDLEQARRTSTIEDVRLWYDREDADPSAELKAILEEKKLAGARVGVELRTFGLTADKYDLVRRRLEGWCELADASHVIRGLRVVKSPAEIAYVRRAAELADQSLDAMLAAAKPGAFEGDIAAAGAVPILAGGGDPPPSGPVLGSGDRALLVRSATGFRHLDAVDQLTMEFAASYRHYCACLMRTIADRPRQRYAATHVRGDARCARRHDRGGKAGPAAGRDRRRAPARLRRRGLRACPHGGLRLFAGCAVPADVDGCAADALLRQSHAGSTGHGALPARHPDRRPEEPRHVARPHDRGDRTGAEVLSRIAPEYYVGA